MSKWDWTRPCACGGQVTADPLDPTPGVRDHVDASPHRDWSDRMSWFPRTTFPDPTAPGALVDLSQREAVRPVRVRRSGHRVYVGGRV